MRQLSESEGNFGKAEETLKPCPKCRGRMRMRIWTTRDGGWQETRYACLNSRCRYQLWTDGPDA